jgi:hypothetical protein
MSSILDEGQSDASRFRNPHAIQNPHHPQPIRHCIWLRHLAACSFCVTFDFAFLFQHFLRRFLAGAFRVTDIIPHSTLRARTICTFDQFFHTSVQGYCSIP